MRSTRTFTVIDAHSAGTPARVITSGVPAASGETIAQQRAWLMKRHDDVRKLLMYEPRGNAQMSGSIIVPPCDPRADLGIVFVEVGGWLTMCGAGTIGAATVAVETGMVPVAEPETTIVFDTPAGLVTAVVEVRSGAVQGVTIENVPSFLHSRDVAVEVPGWGTVSVDVAYGGNYYAIVDTARFGLTLDPARTAELAAVGRAVRAAVAAVVDVEDPVTGAPDVIRDVLLCDEPRPDGAHPVLVFFGENGIDRSPGGTGTSARMAQRYARGLQAIGDEYVQESIIGSRFIGRLTEAAEVGGRAAVVPSITGRAHVTGLTTFVIDPDDPFVEGFGVGYGADAVPRPSIVAPAASGVSA